MNLLRLTSRRVYSTHAPKISNGFIGAIGNTPLIRLNRLSEEVGSDILGKAEWMNPGGSVKDRAALYLINDAEERGLLKPGGTIVEGTAGNTGIGLALMCRTKGYNCIFYMPETMSQEKVDILRLLGAEVYLGPVVSYEDPEHIAHQAKRHAESLDNAIFTEQFHNLANRRAHFETTGPEIYAQTDGEVDGFVCAAGTGGTLAGIAQYLKQMKGDNVKVFVGDPTGSALHSYFTSGKTSLESSDVATVAEGIGQKFVTDNVAASEDLIDGAFSISDEESIKMVYRLLDEEGIYVGLSSALNVVAATKLAKQLGKGKKVVTILCDSAHKYQSKLFSRQWLESKDLLTAIPKHLQKYAILP
ncbi:hypothetical protein [Absidia glauca]|uniref:Cysteine synthase 1 n=1 Tax=Absidia glauca TaxID=4829 RepID=A0A163KNC4_ABSGL|nr:hypothetical protein [Absidia glauca]